MPEQLARSQLEAIGDEIAKVSIHLAMTTHRMLNLIGTFDEHGGWRTQGALSCAHWLSWRVGMDLGAAHEHVRVARCLAKFRKIDEAMSAGRLSYSKVRALTRIASAENEEALVEWAQHSTAAQLEKICSQYRGVLSANAKTALDHRIEEEARYVRHRMTSTGMIKVEALLHADEADIVLRALDAARFSAKTPLEMTSDVSAETPAVVADVSEESSTVVPDISAETSGTAADEVDDLQRESLEVDRAMRESELADDDDHVETPRDVSAETRRVGPDRADSLVAIAESFLASGLRERMGSARVQMVVHVDAAVLAKQSHDGCCETEDGVPLAHETVRRLCCDSSLYAIIAGPDGKPISVSRKTRTIPRAIRRALDAAGRRCRFPGCTHKAFVDAHHIEHWAAGGKTSLANLIYLCRRHHRFVHEEGYRVERLADGELAFFAPSGARVYEVPPIPAGVVDAHRASAETIEEIDPFLLTARGDLRVDYEMAVGALAVMDRLEQRTPARDPCLC